MKNILLPFMLLAAINLAAQTYQKTYGGTASDNAGDIAITKDGGQILVGDTYSFGVAQSDMYFIKTDAAGNVQWSKTFGTAGYDYSRSVIQTNDGGYAVAGTSNGRVALVKLAANGNTQWVKYYSANNRQSASSVVQTPDGGYAIAGQVSTYNNGSWGYLVRTDSTGGLLWSKRIFSRDFYPEITDMTLTKDGGFALAAIFPSPAYYDMYLIKLSSNGNFEWARSIGGESTEIPSFVKQTSDGGYIAGGLAFSYGPVLGQDMFVFKTSANGTLQWAKNFSTPSAETCSDAMEIPGGFVIAGTTDSSANFFRRPMLVHIKSNGTVKDIRIYNEPGSIDITSITAFSNKGFSITGSSGSFFTGSQEMFAARFDKHGVTCSEYDSFGTVKDTGLLVVQTVPVTNIATSVSSGTEAAVSRTTAVTDLCGSIAATISSSITKAGAGTSNMQFHIAPNPATDVLQLYGNTRSASGISVNLFSSDGRKLFTKKFSATAGSNMYSIPVNNLPGGVYILKVHNGTTEQTIKFVKK